MSPPIAPSSEAHRRRSTKSKKIVKIKSQKSSNIGGSSFDRASESDYAHPDHD
jgi:hypothetical protein